VATLAEFRCAGVGLYLHQQALDTGSPAGEAMFGMIGVFAQFERTIIVERVNAGIARAKAESPEQRLARNTKTHGRPPTAGAGKVSCDGNYGAFDSW